MRFENSGPGTYMIPDTPPSEKKIQDKKGYQVLVDLTIKFSKIDIWDTAVYIYMCIILIKLILPTSRVGRLCTQHAERTQR